MMPEGNRGFISKPANLTSVPLTIQTAPLLNRSHPIPSTCIPPPRSILRSFRRQL